MGHREPGFRLLAQLVPVGIARTDASGRCTFANDRWCALTGMSAAEALGASPTDAVHPGDAERVAREWAHAADRGAELRTDCRLWPAATGNEIWVHLAAMPLPGPDGRQLGYLTAITNVTGRKRGEAERERLLAAGQRARSALADQTERLSSLVSGVHPGVVIADNRREITQVNQSFCDLFGIMQLPGQLVGTPLEQLSRRIEGVFADPADFARRTRAALIERRPVTGEQIACTDGRTLQCDYWPVLVDGAYRGDLWLVRDASQRKAIEEHRERALAAELAARELADLAQQRLAEQNLRLRRLDDASTQLLAEVWHELRTPLSSIISLAELIRDNERELSADTAGSLDVIQRSARRLLRVVGDLLLLSRIEGGEIPLDLASVCVPDLIADAARSARPGAAERGVRVEVSSEAGPPVRADPVRLRQVFDDLLSTAVKLTARDPRDGRPGRDGGVRIFATHDEGSWRVDVEDSGTGIPADELGRIFDTPAGSGARPAGSPGTDLGLPAVKAITELHGGRVEAASTAGQGTTFRVYLPIPR